MSSERSNESTSSGKATAAVENQDLEIGRLVGGRYRIAEVIGRGGMGVVYRAEQIFVGKELALKTLNANVLNEVTMRRFQQEARASFALSHPNLITVHDFGVLDDCIPFLVMDLVFGKTIAQHLKDHGVMSYEEALPIFVQVCFAIAYAHDRGVVHRDVKPSNIMLVEGTQRGAEGSVKVVDFGIAKFSQHEDGEIQSLTKTGEIFGSPLYMSPEQCTGGRIDQRADIYSLGCVLFETLTGTPPHIGNSALTTMMHHQNQDAPTLSEASLGKQFPESLEHVMAKMLKKDPDQRYQNMGQVAIDLNAVLKGGSTRAAASAAASAALKEHSMISMRIEHFYGLMAILVVLSATVSALTAYYVGGQRMENDVRSPGARTEKTLNEIDDATPFKIDDKDLQDLATVRDAPPYSLAVMKKIFEENPSVPLLRFKTGNIEAADFREMSTHPKLKWLELKKCRLDFKGLPELAKLPIEKLILDETNFDDDAAATVAKFPGLRVLALAQTPVTDEGLKSLASSNIHGLSLYKTKITDRGLKYLARMKGPLNLKLSKCANITNEGIEALASCNIIGLLIADNPQLDDKVIPALIHMKNLIDIDISGTSISANGLLDLLKHSHIKTLFVGKCPNINERELLYIRQQNPYVDFSRMGEPEDSHQSQ